MRARRHPAFGQAHDAALRPADFARVGIFGRADSTRPPEPMAVGTRCPGNHSVQASGMRGRGYGADADCKITGGAEERYLFTTTKVRSRSPTWVRHAPHVHLLRHRLNGSWRLVAQLVPGPT